MPLPENIEERWQCPECKALCEVFDDSECDCFRDEREVLVCIICNKVFASGLTGVRKRDAEEHARKCFADGAGNPLIPQEELESAGQERLFDR